MKNSCQGVSTTTHGNFKNELSLHVLCAIISCLFANLSFKILRGIVTVSFLKTETLVQIVSNDTR